jgi:MFS family permease
VGGLPLGLGFLLTIPAWMASVSDIDPKRRGANIGAVMTAQGLGAIIGAPIGGFLYEYLIPVLGVHVAHYSPFLCCSACVTAGWLLSLRMLTSDAIVER